MAREVSPELQRSLLQAALLDAVCVVGGVALYLLTGSWIWLVAGALLGAGFILPALIKLMRSGK